MSRRFVTSRTGLVLVIALVLTAVVAVFGQGTTPPAKNTGVAGKRITPRTPWGHPDLQGTWDNHSITPLERPARFAGREFLTAQEAADLEKRAAEENSDEACFQDPVRDVEAAYNDFWWDRATSVVETHRTSLIVDPPDGNEGNYGMIGILGGGREEDRAASTSR